MYLLIDVGGTKTLIAIADKRGKVLHSLKFPTITDQKLFTKNLIQQIRSNFALSDITAIGVAMPGIIKKNIHMNFIFSCAHINMVGRNFRKFLHNPLGADTHKLRRNSCADINLGHLTQLLHKFLCTLVNRLRAVKLGVAEVGVY